MWFLERSDWNWNPNRSSTNSQVLNCFMLISKWIQREIQQISRKTVSVAESDSKVFNDFKLIQQRFYWALRLIVVVDFELKLKMKFYAVCYWLFTQPQNSPRAGEFKHQQQQSDDVTIKRSRLLQSKSTDNNFLTALILSVIELECSFYLRVMPSKGDKIEDFLLNRGFINILWTKW